MSSKVKGKTKQRKNAKPLQKSRKEIRKEQRKQKKVARVAYFQARKEQRVKYAVKSNEVKPVERSEVSKIKYGAKHDPESQKKRKEKKQRELEIKKEKQRKLLLKEDNAKEDRVIKHLEKQLKLNKRKRKAIPKSFVADGLDYLLDFCVGENKERILETERQLLENESDTEFKKDLITVTEEEPPNALYSDNDSSELGEASAPVDDSSEPPSADEYDSDESQKTVEHKLPTAKKAKSDIHLEVDDSNETTLTETIKDQEEEDSREDFWEDIYGRKRDKDGNVVHENKYVPPAARTDARKSDSDDSRSLVLKKHLKGCLNRLAEQNIHSIANQIDELYMTNSRNDMNETLSKLILEALVAPVLTPDRLVAEHMMLIAILHGNVGVEVGAHFLLTFVKKLDETLREPQDIENKVSDNLVLVISHLYNFKIYGYRLLYEILEKLANKFTEKEVDLILLILRTVGFPLRKDDPVALKEFIQNVQQKASREKVESSRMKYMLDTLLAIKNNNVSKIPQYDPSRAEHLKKVVKSVLRKGNTITPFNVSLQDLLHADERGKWWIVGSAWVGSGDANDETKPVKNNGLVFGQKMLELARKQRMNTDARRNIFCILMTAEDYLDAFEKLHHLGLKDHQEREIIHVLIHCCLQEKKFNPYYAVLAQKFCEYDRKYQLTIQYTLWDKLRELETHSPKQLSNLARFLTRLLVEKSVALSILKVVQFTELDKHITSLLRQIILGILLHENEEACLQVFERIRASPQLQNFRESLRLFINHFLIKNMASDDTLGEKEKRLKIRADLVDKMLTSRESKVVF